MIYLNYIIDYIGDNYWECEIPNHLEYYFDDMPKEFKYRMRNEKRHKNTPWFTVYLLKNGPTKTEDIRKAIWPNGTSMQAELFNGMRKCKIIKSVKGFQEVCPFKDWKMKYLYNGRPVI